MEAHERVRRAIEAWRRSEAEAVVAAGSGEDVAVVWPRVEPETFVEAALAPEERGAAAAHLARAAFDRATASFRASRSSRWATRVRLERDELSAAEAGWALLDERRSGATARALLPVLRRVEADAAAAGRHGAEAARAWLAATGAPPHPDGGPAPDERRAAAEALLAGTADALVAVRDRLGVEATHQWPARLHGDRALFRPERRHRRIAADIEGWGLQSVLAAHVSVGEGGGAFGGLARRRAPGAIRLLTPSLDGVLGEHAAADRLGRALGLALVSPALPTPLRRPVAATVARAVGWLMVQVATDPLALRRRGLSRREAAESHRVAVATLLVRARLDAAATLSGPGVDRVTRALGTPAEPGHGLLLETSVAGPRFRACAAGLALFGALREHFDEDFFCNPRAAGPIRGAAARGGALSAEAWLGELGGGPTPVARLVELTERALG